jgi:hypothetical protein
MRVILSLLLALMFTINLSANEKKVDAGKEIKIANETIVSADFSKLKKVWRFSSGVEIKPYNSSEKYREINFPTGKWAFFYYRLPYRSKCLKSQYVTLDYKIKANDPKAKFALQAIFYNKSMKRISGKSIVLKNNTNDFQSAEAQYEVPVTTSVIRIGIVVWKGTGSVLLKRINVYGIERMDAAAAASKGIVSKIPVKVPGRNENVSTALPQIKYFQKVPFELNNTFWNNVKPLSLKQKNGRKGNAPSMKLACDDSALYVMFDAMDKSPVSGKPAIYKNDCFEFYFSIGLHNTKPGKYGHTPLRGIQIQVAASPDGKVTTGGVGNKSAVKVKALAQRTKNKHLALIRIPWKNKYWKITPFDSFKVNINAAYLDYSKDKVKKRWTFAPDPLGQLCRNVSLFVPAEICRASAADYSPIVLPGQRKISDIPPRFEGVYNLETAGQASSMDYGLWSRGHDVKYYFDKTQSVKNKPALCIDGMSTSIKHKKMRLSGMPSICSNAFVVQPGETIIIKLRAKSGKKIHQLQAMLLSQVNWQWIQVKSKKNITPQWQDLSLEMKIPEKFAGYHRNARIFLSIANIAGDKVWIAERKILRKTPIPFDMQLSLPGKSLSHFFGNESKRLDIKIHSGAKEVRKVKLAVHIRDYLTKQKVFDFVKEIEIHPGREQTISELMDFAEKGIFDIRAELYDTEKNKISRSLAFSVGVSPGNIISDYYGIWTQALKIPSLSNMQNLLEIVKKSGINKVCFSRIQEFTIRTGQDDYDNFSLCDELMAPFVTNNFKIGFAMESNKFGTHGVSEQSVARIYDRVHSLFAHYRGKVEWFSFGAENNLTTDGRVRAIQLRTAYNAAKFASPQTRMVTLAPLNNRHASRSFDIDYFTAYHQINGVAFSDGYAGAHCYNFRLLDDTFRYRLKDRQYLAGIFPGFIFWDTESGLVKKTPEEFLFSLTKKMPNLLCAGFKRQYVYNMIDLFIPGGDSSPVLPAMNFQTVIYDGAKPMGYLELNSNVIGYLFKKKSGKIFIVLWKTNSGNSDAPVKIHIPTVDGAGVAYDQFGNDIIMRPLSLNDNFVRYITGVDFKKIIQGRKFISAFKNRPESYIRQGLFAGCADNPYLVLKPVVDSFDLKLQKNVVFQIKAIVRNDSGQNYKIKLTTKLPTGIKATVKPDKFEIKNGAEKQILLSLIADNSFKGGPIKLGGRIIGGKKLVPLTFSSEKTDEVVFNGYSRFVTLKNFTSIPIKVKLLFKDELMARKIFSIYPLFIKTELDKAGYGVKPIKFTFNKKTLTSSRYEAIAEYKGKEHKVSGKAYFMEAKPGNATVKPNWQSLHYPMTPDFSEEGFSAAVEVVRTSAGLRFLARVKDPSPQGGDDKLIIGLDTGISNSGNIYGKEDFECGYSPGKGDKVYSYRYRWRGQYGLESAKPFYHTVKKIERRGGFIYYDINIPFDEFMPSAKIREAKRIGLSLLIENKTKSGKIEKIKFGGGLEWPRQIIKFGVLKLK